VQVFFFCSGASSPRLSHCSEVFRLAFEQEAARFDAAYVRELPRRIRSRFPGLSSCDVKIPIRKRSIVDSEDDHRYG
jgi:hypothetical protein